MRFIFRTALRCSNAYSGVNKVGCRSSLYELCAAAASIGMHPKDNQIFDFVVHPQPRFGIQKAAYFIFLDVNYPNRSFHFEETDWIRDHDFSFHEFNPQLGTAAALLSQLHSCCLLLRLPSGVISTFSVYTVKRAAE